MSIIYLEKGPGIAKNEINGALDETVFVIMFSSVIIEGVLFSIKSTSIEGTLIA